MSTASAQQERRAAQRFEFNLAVLIAASGQKMQGCIQNLSGRGVFLFADRELAQGAVVELTFAMPAEITLSETMRVRCQGRVLRAVRLPENSQFGVAVYLEKYEYLNGTEELSFSHDFERLSSLHDRRHEEAPSRNP